MTTLVAVRTPDDVIIGWDSLVSVSNEQSSLVHPKFFVNEGLVIGVSGTLLALDLLQFTQFPEVDDFTAEGARRYLVTEFVPTLRAALEAHPMLLDENGGIKGFGIIAVVNGHPFDFDSNLAPNQNTDGIYTMGSGGDYARGVLYSQLNQFRDIGKGRTQPDEFDVIEALAAAAAIDPYTGGTLSVTTAGKLLRSSEHG